MMNRNLDLARWALLLLMLCLLIPAPTQATAPTLIFGVDLDRRPITFAEPCKPDYRLDLTIREERGSPVFSAWTGSEWESRTFTGGAAIHTGTPSVIELQLPLMMLDHASPINVALLSADRRQVRGASDLLGAAFDLTAFAEGLVLEPFFTIRH